MSIVSKKGKTIIIGTSILLIVFFARILDKKIFVFKDAFAMLSFQGEVIFIGIFIIIIIATFYLSNRIFKKSI